MSTAKLLITLVLIGLVCGIVATITYNAFNDGSLTEKDRYGNDLFKPSIDICSSENATIDWRYVLNTFTSPFYDNGGGSCILTFNINTPLDEIMNNDLTIDGKKSIESIIFNYVIIIYLTLVGVVAILYFRGTD